MIEKKQCFDVYGFDTRRAHSFMFAGLAPAACTCIIGRYRGSAECHALTSYRVRVGSDPRVGIDPIMVSWEMGRLNQRCADASSQFTTWRLHPGNKIAPEVALLKLVQLACDALEQFLLIHPYANGNGHMARLLVWVILVRHGFPPVSWPMDESPPYGPALSAYRDGNKKPLIAFLLQCMRPAQPAQAG